MTFSYVFNNGFFGSTLENNQLQTFVWLCVLCSIIGYLLGSLNWGVILSHRKYGGDVRNFGSGNAGATNMMRTYGKRAGATTLALDATKALVASFLARLILGSLGAYFAGFFCIVGHAFPVFFKFKGGKGVVVISTMCLLTTPVVFLILLVIYAIVFFGYKMVSLASIMVAGLYPLFLYMFIGPHIAVLIAFLSGMLVIYLHRANIRRILDHTESKIHLGKKKEEKKSVNTDDGA